MLLFILISVFGLGIYELFGISVKMGSFIMLLFM